MTSSNLDLKDVITISISSAALVLGILNAISARKKERGDRRQETERHLDKVWPLIFGRSGYSQTGEDANLREASEVVSRALSINGDNLRALQYQGLLKDLAGEREAAVSFLRKALDIDKRDTKTWNWLGLAIGTKEIDKAIECFERAIELKPEDSASAHFNLARYLRRVDRKNEAHNHFQEAVRLTPRDPERLVGLARSQRGLGQWEMAKQTYERAVSADRHHLEAMIELGALVAEREHWKKGLAWLLEAKRLDPTDSYAAATLAVLHSRKGELDEADKYYEEAVAIDPRLRLVASDLQRLKERIEEERELDFPKPADEAVTLTGT